MLYIFYFISAIVLAGVQYGVVNVLISSPYELNLLLIAVVTLIYEQEKSANWFLFLVSLFFEFSSPFAPGTYFSAFLLLSVFLPLVLGRFLYLSRPFIYLLPVTVLCYLFLSFWIFGVNWALLSMGFSVLAQDLTATLKYLPFNSLILVISVYPIYWLMDKLKNLLPAKWFAK